MKAVMTVIRFQDLHSIFHSIIERHSHVGIRFRTSGELWYPDFLRVIKLQGRSIQLFDDTRELLISLRDLSAITALELNAQVDGWQPNTQYFVFESQAEQYYQ